MPKIKVKGQKVQTGERPQTNGRTDGRYQTYIISPATRSIKTRHKLNVCGYTDIFIRCTRRAPSTHVVYRSLERPEVVAVERRRRLLADESRQEVRQGGEAACRLRR